MIDPVRKDILSGHTHMYLSVVWQLETVRKVQTARPPFKVQEMHLTLQMKGQPSSSSERVGIGIIILTILLLKGLG